MDAAWNVGWKKAPSRFPYQSSTNSRPGRLRVQKDLAASISE
jgi:hypothetical protein